MATRAFHIISDYEAPSEREEGHPVQETAEEIAAQDAHAWSQAQTFSVSQRIARPPKFVKPSGLYDDNGRPIVSDYEDDDEIQIIDHKPSDIGSWYRGLKRANDTGAKPPPPVTIQPEVNQPPTTTSSVETAPTTTSAKKDPTWFLSRVLHSQLSGSSTPLSHSSSTSSLADMLSRAPPPLPSEAPFVPPVWTVLGPANQGYGMLQKFGWEEGKPLGLQAPPSNRTLKSESDDEGTIARRRGGIGFKDKEKAQEVEVVDLTADSDDEDDELNISATHAISASDVAAPRPHHDGRALLTPLPTILRADRSGIGSKAGLAKNIKHTSEALRLLELKKKRNSRRGAAVGPDMSIGGARRFARMAKRDARDRAELLAFMKS
ncbi:hypothetical protein FRB94_008348 [Tulasnella sp. JGI-2019a]|nr:hypothetical protein FRB93_002337 [Tulasnella sp. JGI-2019a]KAG8996432.1 hypothetical protein FRB94_008348 [Tulasnella sp. JGI-2019a]